MNYECIACTTTPKSEFLELANTYFEHNFLLQRWYFSFLTLGRPKHSCKHSLNLEALFHPPCVWKGMKPGDLQRERLWHFKQDWTIQQTTQRQTKSAELAQSVWSSENFITEMQLPRQPGQNVWWHFRKTESWDVLKVQGTFSWEKDERLEKWMTDEKKDKRLCECAAVEAGGNLRGGKEQRGKLSVLAGEGRINSLSGDENINASEPVSHMIIIAQFDWLVDRRARWLLVVTWAGLAGPTAVIFGVCIKPI